MRYRNIFLTFLSISLAISAMAQRVVDFPPAESKPPPPVRAPPRTQASGEDMDILRPDEGPTMRKTQERSPPPPTTLTVMVKVSYGEVLKYVWPDGREQTFEQWQSYQNDGQRIMQLTNERLDDGNNYQYAVEPLSSPVFDPVDIPLLYMTGDYDFALTESEVQNIRRFILDGGTILLNAARGRDEFSRSAVREMRRVFPRKNFMRLPPDHPVFNNRYRLQQVMTMINGVQFMQTPEIYAIDIGTRASVILVPGGLGAAWSEEPYHPAGKHVIGESAERLGVNIVAYVLSSTEYGRFLAQEFPVYSAATGPGDRFRFGLVRYAGSWDVHPALQNNVLSALHGNTGIDVDFAPTSVALGDAELANLPLVVMTGHYDFQLTDEERNNLRNYLERGGMLFTSSSAGFSAFDRALRRELREIYPDNDLIPLPPTHPVFASGWNRVENVEYTSAALRDDPGLEHPVFYAMFVNQRIAVLHTPYDLFSAINRESNAFSRGLVPEDAVRVGLNIITYALSH